jgi:hypothetical protein
MTPKTSASLKRWGVAFVGGGMMLLVVAILRDAARLVEHLKVSTATASARLAPPSLAEAKSAIDTELAEIYSALTHGEPILSAPYVAVGILQNAGTLDLLCRPYTYRAHYIESFAERPDPRGDLVFQARVRVLVQPLEEAAQTMVFRLINGRYVLQEVKETGDDWFGTQEEEAEDVVRRFLYAAKAGEDEVAAGTLSPGLSMAHFREDEEFDRHVAWMHEVQIRSVYLRQYRGLKLVVRTMFPEPLNWTSYKNFYLERIGGRLKIVRAFEDPMPAWKGPEVCEDPDIETYTLRRFGIASEAQTEAQ